MSSGSTRSPKVVVEAKFMKRSWEVDGSTSVINLKRKIQEQTRIPVLHQILLANGKPLLHGNSKLLDCTSLVVDEAEEKIANITLTTCLEPVTDNIDKIVRQLDRMIATRSTNERDLVLMHNPFPKLNLICKKRPSKSTLQSCARCIASLCSGKPEPKLKMVKPAIKILSDLITFSDAEILHHSCRSLMYLSNGDDELVKAIFDEDDGRKKGSTFCRRLVELLDGHDNVAESVLKTLSNFTIAESDDIKKTPKRKRSISGPEDHSQILLEAGVLPAFQGLLKEKARTLSLKALCCRVISMLVQHKRCISIIISSGLLRTILGLFRPKKSFLPTPITSPTKAFCILYVPQWSSESMDNLRDSPEFIAEGVLLEAVWVMVNITCDGGAEDKLKALRLGMIDALCLLLGELDEEILLLALEGIDNLLKAGKGLANVILEDEEESSSSDPPNVVRVSSEIEFLVLEEVRFKGLDMMLQLLTDSNITHVVKQKVASIMTQYFPEEAKSFDAGMEDLEGEQGESEMPKERSSSGKPPPLTIPENKTVISTTQKDGNNFAGEGEEAHESDDDDESVHRPSTESIKVVVRCRPFIKNESKDCLDVIHVDLESNRILVKDPNQSGFNPEMKESWRKFSFDTVYGRESKQKDIYKHSVSKMVRRLLKGFNSTIFAYGQTSSGKTHTMMGNVMLAKMKALSALIDWYIFYILYLKGELQDDHLEGITPRLIRSLFSLIEKGKERGNTFLITLSYLEIYNEKVYDLLTRQRKRGIQARESLQIRQKGNGLLSCSSPKSLSDMYIDVTGFHVPKLTKHVITDDQQMLAFIEMGRSSCFIFLGLYKFALIDKGSRARSTAATALNSASSRSHSMLIINIEKGSSDENMRNIVSAKLNLVDLAGSERFQDQDMKTQKESTSINQSLTALAGVIAALTSNKKGTFVPYRNSALTKLLRDSLGGNASTLMFANINPCDRNLNESVSTLRYAARAKKIMNKPKVNQNPKDALLTKLQSEIKSLRRLLDKKDKYIEKMQVQTPKIIVEEPSEEERRRVREDLLNRLNDAKSSFIQGGSPRARGTRGAFYGYLVVAAGSLVHTIPARAIDDDDAESPTNNLPGIDPSILRSVRTKGKQTSQHLTNGAAPQIGMQDEIQAGVFKAMRKMRRSKWEAHMIGHDESLATVSIRMTKVRKVELETDLKESEEQKKELEENLTSTLSINAELKSKLEIANEQNEELQSELTALRKQLLNVTITHKSDELIMPRSPRNVTKGVEEGSLVMEIKAYSQYVNTLLAYHPLLMTTRTLPIQPTDIEDFAEKMRDGILPAVLINFAVPNTIDERVLNKPTASKPLSEKERRENLILVFETCKGIGVEVGDLTVDALFPTGSVANTNNIQNPVPRKSSTARHQSSAVSLKTVCTFAFRIISFITLRRNELLSHPEVREAGIAQDDNDSEDLLPSKILLGWTNHMLGKLRSNTQISTIVTSDAFPSLPLSQSSFSAKGNKVPAFLVLAISQKIRGPQTVSWLASKMKVPSFAESRESDAGSGISPADFAAAGEILPKEAKTFLINEDDFERKHDKETEMSLNRLALLFTGAVLKHSFPLKFNGLHGDMGGHPESKTVRNTVNPVEKLIRRDRKAGGSIVSVSDDTDIDEDEGTGFIMGGKHDLILAALDGRWMWINNIGVQNRYIHRLLNACSNGVLLLRLLDHIAKSVTQQASSNPPVVRSMSNVGNKFRELANCQQFIERCKETPFNFKVGTTTGQDINERHSKHVLSVTWQLRKFHMFEFLKSIYVRKFGGGQKTAESKIRIDEGKIAQWCMSTIETALDENGGYPPEASHVDLEGIGSKIKGFDEKTLKTGLYLLLLIWAKDPESIDWANASTGVTRDQRLGNATYAISVARKMGCTIFLQPADIIKVRPRMILSFVSAVLAT
eukprot:jgi/Bigna1/86507/estExt_fgenesh1_pg.C_110060